MASAPGAATVPVIGLTGGIGAGKSTALRLLGELGATTLSTDDVVHGLYGRGDVVAALRARWGDEVATDDRVDRAAVARRAFADPDERAWLEQLLWPLVGQEVTAFCEAARRADPPPLAAVVEVPLLFEADMQAAYDATIAVVAPEAVRRRRAADRGHEAVDERAARQLSQEDKARRATHAVVNDGDEEQLRGRLAAVLAQQRAGGGPVGTGQVDDRSGGTAGGP